MNKKRRYEKLQKRAAELFDDLEELRIDMQDAYDNMPENLQDSMQGEKMYSRTTEPRSQKQARITVVMTANSVSRIGSVARNIASFNTFTCGEITRVLNMHSVLNNYTRRIIGNVAVDPGKCVYKFDGQIIWKVKGTKTWRTKK